jgi:hypothetical protein
MPATSSTAATAAGTDPSQGAQNDSRADTVVRADPPPILAGSLPRRLVIFARTRRWTADGARYGSANER